MKLMHKNLLFALIVFVGMVQAGDEEMREYYAQEEELAWTTKELVPRRQRPMDDDSAIAEAKNINGVGTYPAEFRTIFINQPLADLRQLFAFEQERGEIGRARAVMGIAALDEFERQLKTILFYINLDPADRPSFMTKEEAEEERDRLGDDYTVRAKGVRDALREMGERRPILWESLARLSDAADSAFNPLTGNRERSFLRGMMRSKREKELFQKAGNAPLGLRRIVLHLYETFGLSNLLH